LKNGWDLRRIAARVLRPRVAIYTAILGGIVVAAGTALFLRVPLKVDVIRDRNTLAREVEGGLVENVYRLQVMNTIERPRRIEIAVEGDASLQGLALVQDPGALEIPATASRLLTLRVRTMAGSARGAKPITFVVTSNDGGPPVAVREKSRFLVP